MSDEAERQARARIGNVLNEKWTLERLLGSGGMGSVYAARHRNGARAAVKILHPELARDPGVRERFLREGYAANRVEHPGAVKVLDDDVITSGPDEGGAYLVMELLEGESLEERVARGGPPSERELLLIADAVLEVLEAAHASGVVHRDIKPENLFLLSGEGLRIKVLDFGLARLLEAHSTTTHGLALGTPSFMSPEQAGGKSDAIDGRTDLFSLAASCFRVATGRPVHEGVGPVDRVLKMANVPPPKIAEVAPRVSAPFARVIDHALAFRREDRYATATLMRADVAQALAELPPPPPPAPLVAPLATPASNVPAMPLAREPARPRRRSFIPFLVVLVVGAIGAKVLYDARRGAGGPVGAMTDAAPALTPPMPEAEDAAPLLADDGPAAAPPEDAPDDAADDDGGDDDDDDAAADGADAALDAASSDDAGASDAAPRDAGADAADAARPTSRPHPPHPHGPRPPHHPHRH